MNARRSLLGIAALCALLSGVGPQLSACFSPTYQEGLACTESGECPGDLACIQSLCVSSDTQNSPDSGLSPRIDAATETADAAVDTTADAAVCAAGSETIEATGAIVQFAVPDCITLLTVEAFGAEGGGGVAAAVAGGKGARVKGDVVVAGGDVLDVLVGMRGSDGVQIGAESIGEQGGGSGGGGTFVVAANGDALIVAGGGGGASHNTIAGDRLIPGGDGSILSAGQMGAISGGTGGTGGGGGGIFPNVGFHSGTGGGGFTGDAVGSSNGNQGNFGSPNAPGSSFASGGAGGVAGSDGRNGGFGGGGSSGFTGGGGGGYSGGGGGGTLIDAPHAGGGAGSINTGTNQDDSPGVRVGDGQVIISWAP